MSTDFGEVKELECILEAGPGREGHGLVRAVCIRRASPDVRELSAEAFTHPEGAETIGRILATAGLAVSFSAMIPCGLGQFS